MNLKIDTTKAAASYSQALRRLRVLPGLSQQDILRAEAGSILKAWVLKTRVTTKDQAERRARSGLARSMGMQKADMNQARITVNNGGRGGFRGEVWFRTRNKRWQQAGVISRNDEFVPANLHFRPQDWSAIRALASSYAGQLTKRRESAIRSIGLNRQSVVQIADDLGIDLEAVEGGRGVGLQIAKARAAIASNGQAYKNGSGYISGDNTRTFVTLINSLPYNVKTRMDLTLAVVIAGRAGKIEQSYKRGVFNSMQSVAQQFPNLVQISKQPLAV